MTKNIKILVADDSAFMRQYVIGFLHEAGYKNIIEAGNGQIAIDKFESEKPDLVLLDIIMPVVTGLQVIEKLVPRGAKIIIISAIGQKSIMDKALKSGAKDFLVKPFFDAHEIDQKIQKTLA